MTFKTKSNLTAALLTVVLISGMGYQLSYNRHTAAAELKLPFAAATESLQALPVYRNSVDEKPFWKRCVWDEKFFVWLNLSLNRFPFSEYVLGWATHLAEPYVFFPVTFLLGWIWDRKNLKRVIISLFLVYLVSNGFCMFLKEMTGRVRPYFYFQEAYNEGKESLRFMFGAAPHGSFPSGHTANAAMVAVFLNLIYRGRLKRLYLFILWIALSRLYVGAHYPLDVLAGALSGAMSSFLVFHWLRMRGFLNEKIVRL